MWGFFRRRFPRFPGQRLRTTDPMERIIERHLIAAETRYETEMENEARLDFYLPDHGLYIEVKQFHSDRIADQMKRAPNVIAAQGRPAVKALGRALELYLRKQNG